MHAIIHRYNTTDYKAHKSDLRKKVSLYSLEIMVTNKDKACANIAAAINLYSNISHMHKHSPWLSLISK